MENAAENFQKIIEQYQRFLSTPNPDDPNFEDKNTAFNYLRDLDENKAYEILHHLDRLGIDRNFLRRVTVDHRIEMLQPNIGGYFALDKNFIGLNSAILRHGSVNTIVHIIYHEALHAGVIKDLEGVRVKDEALVEFITVQKMKQEFGRDDFISGYTNIVHELEILLGVEDDNFDINRIIEQINSSNIEMLDRFLEIIVLNPLLESWNVDYLSYWEIEDELKKKWNAVLKLFPRLVNDIDSPSRGPHEEALMRVDEYKLENLLRKAAERIFHHPVLIFQILQKVNNNLGKYIQDEKSLRFAMRDLGYGYLVDFAEENGIDIFSLTTYEQ